MTLSSLVLCPECTSSRIWKDGVRYVKEDKIQRYLCRECGYRFSLNKSKLSSNVQTEALSTVQSIDEDCQICALEAKNLVKVESRIEKRAAGATLTDIKGKVVEYAWWMKTQGYRESTIKMRSNFLKLLVKRGADLLNPESVKETIAMQSWSENTKVNVVSIYDNFLEMLGIKWNPPKYRLNEKLPFIPLESEIDQLISAAAKKLSAFLQLLKETAMRSGEAWSIKWVDVDCANNTVMLKRAEKHGNPRLFKVSSKLIAMLNQLPKHDKRLFKGKLNNFRMTFLRLKKRLSHKLQNPRFLEIHFHSLRHWKATMEYHKTKDILHVKQFLGHKNIDNTLRYTQLVNFESNEYVTRATKTVKGARLLLEAGFEYVCDVRDVKLFRKRK